MPAATAIVSPYLAAATAGPIWLHAQPLGVHAEAQVVQGIARRRSLTGRLLYRIATDVLRSDDPEQAGRKVEKAGSSCVADGLLMTRDGQLLITSPEDSSIKLWEGDRARTVLAHPNLRWPDSMAEAPDGSIYVTASRIQDSAWFNKDAPAALPTRLFRMVKSGEAERATYGRYVCPVRAGSAPTPPYNTDSGRWTRVEDSWVVGERIGWCAVSHGGEPWRGLLLI